MTYRDHIFSDSLAHVHLLVMRKYRLKDSIIWEGRNDKVQTSKDPQHMSPEVVGINVTSIDPREVSYLVFVASEEAVTL